MGHDLMPINSCEKLYQEADQVLGYPISQICFEGPETSLTETRYCQPALYVHGLACLLALRERSQLQPAFCAGLSLGEFTAHAAAGTFTFADGLRLVAARGAAMQEACNASKGGMVSLIGANTETARAIAHEADVDIANLNCPGQIVLSGADHHISRVVEVAKTHSIKRAIPLKVAGAYHSRLMQSAKDKLAAAMQHCSWQTPVCPVIANFTAAAVTEVEAIRAAALEQVTGSVRWEESILLLREQGVHHFIEFGPGEVLAGLIKRIDPHLKCTSIAGLGDLHRAEEFIKHEKLS